MGASESKLAFKEDIFRLAGEENIPIESQWWSRVCTPFAQPCVTSSSDLCLEIFHVHPTLDVPAILTITPTSSLVDQA
jgi:hypothetical protein